MTIPSRLRFGVEVEMTGLTPSEAARAVEDHFDRAPNPGGGDWTVVRDASVPDGFELRSPPLTYADMPVLEGVFVQLRRAGAVSSPATTGLHVHVDAERFTVNHLMDLAFLWSNAEPALHCLLDVHPRRMLRYCRPVGARAPRLTEAPVSLAELRELWSADSDPTTPSKHHGLNLESYDRHGTVEFRAFNSVDEPSGLRACVLIALAFAERACRGGRVVRLARADTITNRADALATIGPLTGAMGLTPATRAVVVSHMTRMVTRRFATQVFKGPVGLHTDRGSSEAPSFRLLLQRLLDVGTIEVTAAAGLAQAGKPELPLTEPTDPEAYSRAVVESFASRGHGTLVVAPVHA